jgi:hypothetical protein
VNELNLSTDFNFFYWKNYLFKLLTPAVGSPFSWMLADRENVEDKDQYSYMMDALVRMELVRRKEREEMVEVREGDLEGRKKLGEKIIRKVILKDINK